MSTERGGHPHVRLEEKDDEIVDRYVEQGEPLQSIATDYGTVPEQIRYRLRESGIELRSTDGKAVDVGFSPHQISVIQGELLGDGCLFQRESGGCFFRLSNSVKEHTLRVEEKLPDGLFPENAPRSNTRADTFGPEYTMWILRSRLQPLFEEMYSDWYKKYDGKRRKVVPEDFQLDRTALLHWFWGDGCCSIRDSGAPRIIFSTHGFPESSVQTLQAELERFGYDNHTSKQEHVENGSGLGIQLSDISARNFLEDTRPRNSVMAYNYKFPVPDP
ncbi:endonuclease I [Haloarcula sp. H-GB4]|uniref:endonuclease I n=1 Tax=Haloarcula sp. H-GB4 TaxID=3069755 RepID=UPI0027AF809F|nr:endonuclease I [Haloarcula sp. H-GB4]MDQ2072341.1 endonuclease I [Haloarcula sp. H-GB4]